mgnify:CR=1 FL=1
MGETNDSTSAAGDEAVHVQIVLDRSGSMDSIASATVDALNGFLAKQRAHPGMLRLSLADFDSQEPFRLVIDAVPIAEVLDLTDADFQPRGGTPLLDAIGRAVERVDARLVDWPDEDQVLVVMTDGYENASTDYTGETIAKLLDSRQEAGWSVLFLGANQDAFGTGDALNMRQGNVRDFDATPSGVHEAVALAADAVYDQRSRSRAERRLHADELFDLTDDDR